MTAIRLVFAANVLVAGAVGLASLIGGAPALRGVWQSAVEPSSQPVRIVGAFWTTIALLSIMGLASPRAFAPVLLVQLLYKGIWLAVVALPALVAGRGSEIPAGIAVFFAAWVLVLPFVIPFRAILAAA